MEKGICIYFHKCQFYKKYCRNVSRKEKITVFHEYISVYCYGPLRTYCHRWIARDTAGEIPPADITPSGAKYTFSEQDTVDYQ